MYKLCCLSDSSSSPAILFGHMELAETWMMEHALCPGCKEEVKQGYVIYSDPDEEEELRMEIEGPFSTACGAEWMLLDDQDMAELGEEFGPRDILEHSYRKSLKQGVEL